MHNRRLENDPLLPSFARKGCMLIMLPIPNSSAGQARNRLRVTIMRPDRNIPEVFSPSKSWRYQVVGVENLTSRDASLGSSILDIERKIYMNPIYEAIYIQGE